MCTPPARVCQIKRASGIKVGQQFSKGESEDSLGRTIVQKASVSELLATDKINSFCRHDRGTVRTRAALGPLTGGKLLIIKPRISSRGASSLEGSRVDLNPEVSRDARSRTMGWGVRLTPSDRLEGRVLTSKTNLKSRAIFQRLLSTLFLFSSRIIVATRMRKSCRIIML